MNPGPDRINAALARRLVWARLAANAAGDGADLTTWIAHRCRENRLTAILESRLHPAPQTSKAIAA